MSFKQKLMKELSIQVQHNPRKSVKELFDEYMGRSDAEPVTEVPKKETSIIPASSPVVLAQPIDDIWTAWYSTNSINLLLYVGAFLIVSAAAIFVGFAWETIPGVTKALLLTGFTGASLLGGIWFYGIPKIKNAGATFIAIATILTPVLGAAWYTFVLRPEGIPFGIVWLVTSVIALTVYVSLALYMRTAFYSYASTIGTFSLMLSLVNTLNLSKDFYILAGILSCFILLIIKYQSEKLGELAAKTFSVPAEISSEIAMPITLIYGFIMAVSENKLFSLEGVFSAVFAGIFYVISYWETKESWKLALSEVIFFASYYLGCKYLDLSPTLTCYVLSCVSLLYAGIGYYFAKIEKANETDVSITIAQLASILVFFIAWMSPITSLLQACLSLFPLVISLLIAGLKKNPYPLLLSSSFFAIFLYILYIQVFQYSAFPQYLGLIYLTLGVARYILTFTLSKKSEIVTVGHITIVGYCAISLLLMFNHPWMFCLGTAVIALLLFSTAVLQKIEGVTFGGVFFLFLSLLIFLNQMNIEHVWYPLTFVGFAYFLFGISRTTESHLQKELKESALLIAFGSSVYYFFTSQYLYGTGMDLTRNALIESYGTTILFGLELYFNQTAQTGYVTSAIALLTILWQLHYSGMKDILWYSTPIGIYFLILAHTRKFFNDFNGEQTLSLIGSAFLLLPPFLLSYGDQPMKYSVILGIEGMLLLGTGITITQPLYRVAGVAGIILAVLPQTYNFILSLPRWLVVGTGGMIFLIVAIFLLLKRKED